MKPTPYEIRFGDYCSLDIRKEVLADAAERARRHKHTLPEGELRQRAPTRAPSHYKSKSFETTVARIKSGVSAEGKPARTLGDISGYSDRFWKGV